jgi:hypothetical protein
VEMMLKMCMGSKEVGMGLVVRTQAPGLSKARSGANSWRGRRRTKTGRHPDSQGRMVFLGKAQYWHAAARSGKRGPSNAYV